MFVTAMFRLVANLPHLSSRSVMSSPWPIVPVISVNHSTIDDNHANILACVPTFLVARTHASCVRVERFMQQTIGYCLNNFQLTIL